MAAKKYYAVKKGMTTGIFRTWEECRSAVEGYSGAEYKGFARLDEAQGYLGMEAGPVEEARRTISAEEPGIGVRAGKSAESDVQDEKQDRGKKSVQGQDSNRIAVGFLEETASEVPEPGMLLAYVDGSYDNALKKYSFGCVFILPDGRICTEYGNGDNVQSLQHRNVTGEMLGAMYAVKTAMLSGFSKVELRYDYEGIEKWVTGAWRSRTELTKKYAMAMQEWGKSIEVRFTKVAAHTNVYYNELADKMAKAGLREGEGIPRIRSLTRWDETR